MKANPRSLTAAVALAVALTCGGAAVKGKLGGRWGYSEAMARAASLLHEAPQSVGDWELQTAREMAPSAQALLQCAGHVHGAYVHRETGERVDVTVLVGPAGPLSVHTPEFCYSARQYEVLSERRRMQLKDDEQSLWSAPLRTRDLDAQAFCVCYGWSVDGRRWEAAEHPRWIYGGKSHLFKLQLAGRAAPSSPEANEEACRRFLESYLPVLAAQFRVQDTL